MFARSEQGGLKFRTRIFRVKQKSPFLLREPEGTRGHAENRVIAMPWL